MIEKTQRTKQGAIVTYENDNEIHIYKINVGNSMYPDEVIKKEKARIRIKLARMVHGHKLASASIDCFQHFATWYPDYCRELAKNHGDPTSKTKKLRERFSRAYALNRDPIAVKVKS